MIAITILQREVERKKQALEACNADISTHERDIHDLQTEVAHLRANIASLEKTLVLLASVEERSQ